MQSLTLVDRQVNCEEIDEKSAVCQPSELQGSEWSSKKADVVFMLIMKIVMNIEILNYEFQSLHCSELIIKFLK